MVLIIVANFKNKDHEDDGYGKNLEPIHSEINNIKNHEKAIKLILKNLSRVQKENNNNTELYRRLSSSIS